MKKLRPIERTWLACAIDGEGWLGFVKTRRERGHPMNRGFRWRGFLRVNNTNRKFCNRAKTIVGEGTISTTRKDRNLCKSKTRRWKVGYDWSVGAGTMKWLLPQLLPHFIIKKRQAELLFEAVSLLRDHKRHFCPHDSRLETIYNKMKLLNQRGGKL